MSRLLRWGALLLPSQATPQLASTCEAFAAQSARVLDAHARNKQLASECGQGTQGRHGARQGRRGQAPGSWAVPVCAAFSEVGTSPVCHP